MDKLAPASSIQSKLHQGWCQERRFYHLRGASRLAIWLIALFALAFLIDWGLFSRTGVPGSFRVLLLLVSLGVLGWVLWFEWLRHLKPFDPVIVALEVENRNPKLSSRLVSYVQLDKPSDDQPNVSAELIEAMREQTVSMARPLDFRDIVDFRQLKNLLIVAACVLLLFGALSVRWSDHLGILLQRLVGLDKNYPTQTQVVDITSGLVVRIGGSAVIRAEAAKVIPDAGRIFTRPADDADANWTELPLQRDGSGNTFSRELKDLSGDLLYYVRINDGRSGEHRLRVIPSPQLVAKNVLLEFPPYTKLAPLVKDELDLEVPEGTEILWTLQCDVPVKQFEVKVDDVDADADPIDVQIDATGKKLSFAMTADKAIKYTFRWVERDSGKDFEFDDVQYSIRVMADMPPEVELLQPATNGLATLKKTLALEANATDDYGLAKAWLVYSLDGSEEQRVPIPKFNPDAGKKIAYDWKLQDGIKDLKIGSQVTFAIEVADNYPDEQEHLRRSTTRQLTIVDPKRYSEWARSKFAAQTEEMKRSREAEVLASRKVKEIKVQEDPTE